jgi:hypothetical protein
MRFFANARDAYGVLAQKPKNGHLLSTVVVIYLLSWLSSGRLMADELLTIDDRRSGALAATLGGSWRMVTDGVMGGVSSGTLSLDSIDGKACLRLQGDVRLENNGGFIQAVLDIKDTEAADASGYTGLLLEVYGNDQEYNLHLRTDDVWLPWQAYRASLLAPARWRTVRLPFSEFEGYRIGKRLDVQHLERIGLVAIGRAFRADLCVAKVALYRAED